MCPNNSCHRKVHIHVFMKRIVLKERSHKRTTKHANLETCNYHDSMSVNNKI